MLDIINLTKRFHSLTAVNKVSIHVEHGQVLGVLGPNGAGKTTLFKVIAGLLYPDEGNIRYSNNKIPAIGYKPERLLFPNQLRVSDYLSLVASLNGIHGRNAKNTISSCLYRVGLANASDKRIKDCSKGMRQRLGFAQIMLGNSELLLLDEPSNGLDPEGQDDICQLISALHEEGKTIILASHQLHEVTRVCTNLVILNRGSIHYENSIENALAERPHATIHVNSSLEPLKQLLTRMHPDIEVNDRQLILNYDAIQLRPRVLGLLLHYGFDITNIEHHRVSLSEIYAEAVK